MSLKRFAEDSCCEISRYVGRLYAGLFYAIIPTLFSYFLLFCYPYILLKIFEVNKQSSHVIYIYLLVVM